MSRISTISTTYRSLFITSMVALFGCADPPPEHPTAKQWCGQVQALQCTEEQGFTSREDCEEEMGFVEEFSLDAGCKSDYEEFLKCNWYLENYCTSSCDQEAARWSSCVE